MKAFAIWYFEWGFILTAMIGLPVGYYSRSKGKPWVVMAYILAVFFGGLILLQIKHS